MSVVDKLDLINSYKSDIKSAIIGKGVDMTNIPLSGYASKIGEIVVTEPIIESLDILSNGNYHIYSGVDGYNPVNVNVPSQFIGIQLDDILTNNVNMDVLNDPNITYLSYQIPFKTIRYVDLPNCTEMGSGIFSDMNSLSYVNLPNCSSFGQSAFWRCYKLEDVNIPLCTSVSYMMFWLCYSLSTISLPNCSNLYNYGFAYCSALQSVYLTSDEFCTIENNVFPDMNPSLAIYVNYGLYDRYISYTNWVSLSSHIKRNITPKDYFDLEITGKDVRGNDTKVKISYSVKFSIEESTGIFEETGEDVVTIPKNPSYEESREVEISYEKYGLIATTTITQGPASTMYYEVDLNDQWMESDKNPDSDNFECFKSFSNYHIDNSVAWMKITFEGYENFVMYINSYAESSYDYTIAFDLDVERPAGVPVDYSAGVKAHTKKFQHNPELPLENNFKKVEYPNDGGQHFIWIAYRKDGSNSSADDCGYILIPRS